MPVFLWEKKTHKSTKYYREALQHLEAVANEANSGSADLRNALKSGKTPESESELSPIKKPSKGEGKAHSKTSFDSSAAPTPKSEKGKGKDGKGKDGKKGGKEGKKGDSTTKGKDGKKSDDTKNAIAAISPMKAHNSGSSSLDIGKNSAKKDVKSDPAAHSGPKDSKKTIENNKKQDDDYYKNKDWKDDSTNWWGKKDRSATDNDSNNKSENVQSPKKGLSPDSSKREAIPSSMTKSQPFKNETTKTHGAKDPTGFKDNYEYDGKNYGYKGKDYGASAGKGGNDWYGGNSDWWHGKGSSIFLNYQDCAQ